MEAFDLPAPATYKQTHEEDWGDLGVKQTTPPEPNQSEPIVDMVVRDLNARKEFGVAKYGTPLQAFNGRNALQDAYEEVLDLACYLKQKLEETNQQSSSPCPSVSESPCPTCQEEPEQLQLYLSQGTPQCSR